MKFPKVSDNHFQERQGVLRVSTLLNRAGLVFRETLNADVGIDGHVELVNEIGEATGATIAVQIKSGPSYFRDAGEFWKFYPDHKHAPYWEMYPLPVILMLHDPSSDMVYWDDIRLTLRSDQKSSRPFLIPKAKILIPETAIGLFETCGASGKGLLSPFEALKFMALTRSPNASFPLSYLDIFLEGLTDIGRKIFFSAGMCWDLVEIILRAEPAIVLGMGAEEHDFLNGYLTFIVEQSIAHMDYSDIVADVVHRQLHPTILAPLSGRGRKIRDLCRELSIRVPPRAITEASVGLINNHTSPLRSLANKEVIKQIERHFLASEIE